MPRHRTGYIPVVQLTSLARTLDPRLPSHRTAFMISAAAGAVAWGFAGPDWSDGLGAGFTAGVGAFLAWAIARELDPDRPRSAAISGIFAGAAIILVGGVLLLPTTVVLVTARVLHRSTGLPPTVFDLIALPAVAFVSGTSIVGWSTGLALAYAVARDHRLPEPAPRRQLIAAFLIAGAATAATVINSPTGSWAVPSWSEWLILVIGLAAGMSLKIYAPRSTADHTGAPLEIRRLQSARLGTIGTGVFALLITGGTGIAALSPVWAALTGVAVWDRLGPDEVDHVASATE
ncbi:MAG: hypothetical protein ACN4GK_07945 [Acidimicrobiia bacterium]